MDTRFLQPGIIWDYFGEITQIPRPSGKERAIKAYLLNFAAKHGLAAKEDDGGNILIVKDAAKGCENFPAVILQSHMDMVAEKEASSNHNFETDPIDAYVDGDWVKAKGTTLGADDGIGMAAQLAILSSGDMRHGRIEALFTSDEEVGMTGVRNMGDGLLTGKYFINLDSEEEGEVFIGCAGGERTIATFPFSVDVVSEKLFFFEVVVSGLNGGHSGGDIHRQFGNAIKILARYLDRLRQKTPLYLSEIEGGNLLNAIPRDARAVCAVCYADKETARVELNHFIAEMEDELSAADQGFGMSLQSADDKNIIDTLTANRLIGALIAVPNGVIAMSRDMPGLVETSTNLASIRTGKHSVVVGTSQRSSVNSMKAYIVSAVGNLFKLAGAEVQHGDSYPGWTPRPDSALLTAAKKSYRELYGDELKVSAIHAGLECGLILEKYPHLEMISCGPTMTDVHSPSEKLYIPSVERWWAFLVGLLKNMPEGVN